MTKQELAYQIVEMLKASGLEYSEQVAAVETARREIQGSNVTAATNAILDAWRASRKPIPKRGEKK